MPSPKNESNPKTPSGEQAQHQPEHQPENDSELIQGGAGPADRQDLRSRVAGTNVPARSTGSLASPSRSSGPQRDHRQPLELPGQWHGAGLAQRTLPHDAGPGRPALQGREVRLRARRRLVRLSGKRLRTFDPVEALWSVQGFPDIGSALGIQPELGRVAEDPRQDQRRVRRHRPTTLAKLGDVLPGKSCHLRQTGLQAEKRGLKYQTYLKSIIHQALRQEAGL